VNNELESMWKEAIVASFDVLALNKLEGTEENYRKKLGGITDLWVEISTKGFRNRKGRKYEVLDRDVRCLSYLRTTNFVRIFCFLSHIAYIIVTLLTGNDGLPAAQCDRDLIRDMRKFPLPPSVDFLAS